MYIAVSVRTIQLGIYQLKPNLNGIAYYDNGIMKLIECWIMLTGSMVPGLLV